MARPPELSMLWESVDAAAALTSRFRFTDVDHAVSWLKAILREVWLGRLDRCERLVLSAGNLLAWLTVDGQPVIAKCSADSMRFPRLGEVDALVSWLQLNGVPVAPPVPVADGRLRVEREGLSLGLYPFVRGSLLEVDDVTQVEAAARVLATLHRLLATYPGRFEGQALPDQQLIHGDFRSANLLYDGAGIAAVLDFDEAGYDSKIADLSKAVVMLGTRYHDWAPTSPETRSRFIAAYDEVAPLTSAERDELQRGIIAVLNHFGWR